MSQDWVGFFKEVIRIGVGKPLELEFGMSVCALSACDDSLSEANHLHTAF